MPPPMSSRTLRHLAQLLVKLEQKKQQQQQSAAAAAPVQAFSAQMPTSQGFSFEAKAASGSSAPSLEEARMKHYAGVLAQRAEEKRSKPLAPRPDVPARALPSDTEVPSQRASATQKAQRAMSKKPSSRLGN
ncbi:hypothetical protein PG994_007518 [Apiospora phragmitis]|uniref:Uncharacterized protein n=1 Tax=Apiospora phragmitis TaxID=2905665 RepID=A0ABR1V3N2_9PEZI